MIEARGIKRIFKNGDVSVEVLKGVDIHIKEGEFLAIMGRSGAGKSTLLYQLSLLDEPTEGAVVIDGLDVSTLSIHEKTQYRLEHMGFVFQDYALIPELTAIENVMLPLLMRNVSHAEATKKASAILDQLGLLHRANGLPSELSGGEQQRVSIARAMVHEPKVLFADEPTANLDLQAAQEVVRILETLSRDHGQTIVMVTHEEEYGKRADRIVHLTDGLVDQVKELSKTKRGGKQTKRTKIQAVP
jgi:putative ABC transport system ATP-binding protein